MVWNDRKEMITPRIQEWISLLRRLCAPRLMNMVIL